MLAKLKFPKTAQILVVSFLLSCLSLQGALANSHAIILSASTEDFVDLGPLEGLTRKAEWSLLEKFKVPKNIQAGYQLSRGSAWQDKAGDFLLIVTPKVTCAWLFRNGWIKLDTEVSLADERWHTLCFQQRGASGALELWLDGKLIASRQGVGAADDSANSNHLFLGGQDVRKDYNQGRLYLEQSSMIAHLALFSRALSENEIKNYEGTVQASTDGLLLSTKVSDTSIRDAVEADRAIVVGGSHSFTALETPAQVVGCTLCKDSPGFIIRRRRVQERIPCRACDGKGRSICRMCKGSKLFRGRPCRSCKGSGFKTCRLCRGKGFRTKMVMKEIKIPCPHCSKQTAQPTEAPTPPATTQATTPPPSKAPEDAISLAKRAFAHLNASPPRLEESIVLYRRATALAPTNHVIVHDLGAACFKAAALGDKKLLLEAEASFRRAIELAPTYGKAYNSLGATLGMKKDYDGAVAMLSKAHELLPRDPSVCHHLAHTYLLKYKSNQTTAFLKIALVWSDTALGLGAGAATKRQNQRIRRALGM